MHGGYKKRVMSTKDNVNLQCKWNNQVLIFSCDLTFHELKDQIFAATGISHSNQKIIGIGKKIDDSAILSSLDLKIKVDGFGNKIVNFTIIGI